MSGPGNGDNERGGMHGGIGGVGGAGAPGGGAGDAEDGGATMTISINGEPRAVPAPATVLTVIQHLGFTPSQVAVERNKVLVRRPDHATTVVHAGDALEIVTFFGGG